MANFSSPRPTEVVIGEDNTAEKMLLSLGGTILRGVISDAFSTVRKEQSNKYATLWEAQELRTNAILKLSNPAEVEDAITRFEADYNDISVPESQKDGLKALHSSLQEHHTHLLKKEPSKEVARTIGGYAETIVEAQQENSNLNNDPKFLNKILGQMGEDIEYHADKYIGRMDDEESLNYRLGFPDESETPDAKMRFLAQYIKAKPDGDRLLASQFEIFANEYQMIDQQLLFASEQLAIDTSIDNYGLRLDALRGDKKVYDAKSVDLLLEFSESLTDKGQYMTSVHKNAISDMYEEKRLMVSAVKSLDYIQNIYDNGKVSSEAAKVYLNDAKGLIGIGYETERKDLIAKGLGLLDDARREESAYEKGVLQKMSVDKASLEETTRGLITPVVKSINQKFATAEKRGKNLDSSYLAGGANELSRKPDQFFQNFTIESSVNVKGYKSEVGREMATLVKSSSLKGLDKKQKLIVNDLANKARKGDYEASDELYSILQSESTNLDFEGFGDKDSNAKSIYEQYLQLYKILFETDIIATSKFGADYGYGQLRQAGKLESATDEPTNWF